MQQTQQSTGPIDARTRSLQESLDLGRHLLSRLGSIAYRPNFWSFFLVLSALVLLKTGFRWAGITGDGWYEDQYEVIVNWPSRENVSEEAAQWQEFFAPVIFFRSLTGIGLPESQFTWNLLHIVAAALTLVIVARWVKLNFGETFQRAILMLFMFGAVPLVMLQEIGRYDTLFLLGGALLITSKRHVGMWTGAVLMGASWWVMSLVVGVTVTSLGIVLASRQLLLRGIAALIGSAVAVAALGASRIMIGESPTPDRWRLGNTSAPFEFSDVVARSWWNLVQPFPNWIYAALGVSWILFALAVLQLPRRRTLVCVIALAVPFAAFAFANASDGTRDLAPPLFLTTLALLAMTRQHPPELHRDPISFSKNGRQAALGAVLVLCLFSPVVYVNPHDPINPYGWLGLRGLSVVWSWIGAQ